MRSVFRWMRFRAQGDAAAEVSAIVPSERNERDQGRPRRGRSTVGMGFEPVILTERPCGSARMSFELEEVGAGQALVPPFRLKLCGLASHSSRSDAPLNRSLTTLQVPGLRSQGVYAHDTLCRH